MDAAMAGRPAFVQAEAYDLLHPPAARLARDGAHLAAWTAGAGAVLELACGTGAVAAFLAARPGGGRVAASDLSPAMIAHARARHGDAPVAWSVGDMRAPPAGPADAVLVLGNSLNLLPDRAAVRDALAAIRAAGRPGCRLLLQVINPAAPRYREPVLVRRQASVGGLVAVKSLVPAGDGHLLTLSWRAGAACGAEAMPLLDLGPGDIKQALAAAGWCSWSYHGGLDLAAYDPDASADLVVQAA